MRKRPPFIRHWSEIERPEPHLHPHTKEPMVRAAPFSHRFELKRVGIRHDTIMPGWRSSQPHAERDEEEMVFILEGTPDLWVDGFTYGLKPGDAAGWPGRDGQGHCLINNSDKPGFIGALGTLLGDAKINIATFHLGREDAGQDAIALIGVDQPVSEPVLAQIKALPHVRYARVLRF